MKFYFAVYKFSDPSYWAYAYTPNPHMMNLFMRQSLSQAFNDAVVGESEHHDFEEFQLEVMKKFPNINGIDEYGDKLTLITPINGNQWVVPQWELDEFNFPLGIYVLAADVLINIVWMREMMQVIHVDKQQLTELTNFFYTALLYAIIINRANEEVEVDREDFPLDGKGSSMTKFVNAMVQRACDTLGGTINWYDLVSLDDLWYQSEIVHIFWERDGFQKGD
mgnify:CR=1 FL=1